VISCVYYLFFFVGLLFCLSAELDIKLQKDLAEIFR